MSEDAEVKVDGKLISDIEFEVGMGTGAWDQVEPEELVAAVLKCCSVVPKSAYDAEREHAEQAEAACVEMRRACDEDVPVETSENGCGRYWTSIVEFLEGIADDTNNSHYEYANGVLPQLKAALSSAPGKSTADELRGLRALRDAYIDWQEMPGREFSAKYPDAAPGVYSMFYKLAKAAQPPRAERSE